jgi:hypothetical protein
MDTVVVATMSPARPRRGRGRIVAEKDVFSPGTDREVPIVLGLTGCRVDDDKDTANYRRGRRLRRVQRRAGRRGRRRVELQCRQQRVFTTPTATGAGGSLVRSTSTNTTTAAYFS